VLQIQGNVIARKILAASYVDRILRGAITAELPVQQHSKFEVIINNSVPKAQFTQLLSKNRSRRQKKTHPSAPVDGLTFL
jgi:ABC-type uncharacterized transport system substrate-binding protein